MPPNSIDLSPHIRYIRWQGGAGCWGYSMLAIWDIMNDLVCPFSPNLSLNLGLFLHIRRDLWEKEKCIMSPDGRYHIKKTDAGEEKWIEQSFGCTTEGTEITNPDLRWTGNWTYDGVNEACNYRLSKDITEIPLTVSEIQKWLINNHPVQIEDGPHVIAITGYNNSNSTFTFVNSYGDRYGNGGFGTYSYNDISKKTGIFGEKLGRAFIIDPIPPKPVPVARIKISTPIDGGRRLNINLWLSSEKSPQVKRKIWPPPHSMDSSRILHYTVRLPSEFVWPPSPENRLVLDLYDSGEYSETGGQIEEFIAVFGEHSISCKEITSGPISFKAREHRRFIIS